MLRYPSRPHRAWRLCITACLALLVIAAAAAQPLAANANTDSSHRAARAARLMPRSLAVAARRSVKADRVLVARARTLKKCLSKHPEHPKKCKAARRGVQEAGSKLASATRRLAKAVRSTGKATAGSRGASNASALQAPQLTVSGQTLAWNAVAGLNMYVLVRKVPGQTEQYSVVSGTSTTPPPVPGVTVHYSVRTAVDGSAWAGEQSITYPSASKPASAPVVEPVTTPSLEPVTAPDTQAAPQMWVSGQTITWSATPGVNTYVFARKVPGQPAQYSVVSGTSTTPAAVAGATVGYSIRTAVEGSAWAPEVTISYPAATSPTPPPTEKPAKSPTKKPVNPPAKEPASPPAEKPVSPPAEEPASSPSTLQTGINSGHEPDDFVAAATLGAKLVRVGFGIEDTAAQLRPAIEKYAAEGITVLPVAEFTGRMPSPAEAQDLASWADAYGPGGTFWTGRSDGDMAIKSIEFGNETDYSEQYQDEPGDTSYRLRAEEYAVRVKEAAQAIKSSGSTVGLLVQNDDRSGDWMNGMYAAVPDLTQYVAGWTMHPYGGREYNEYRFHVLIKQAAEYGASSIPIDVTEWGVTTDNGRCLEYNDGLNPCMTYQEAAQEVRNSLAWMKEMLGSKLVMFLFYQTGDQAPSGTTTNWQDYFGALQHEGQQKGPFTEAVEAVLHS